MRKRLSDANHDRRPRTSVQKACFFPFSSFQSSVFAQQTAFEKITRENQAPMKGEVDMKWWLFRVIPGVESLLLWWLPASTKQMTFQWQSTIPPVWSHNGNPLFTGNPERADVRGQNKWLFNGNPGQVKPSCCHFMARQDWSECTRVLCILTPLAVGVYLQCIGSALGTLAENGCGSTAAPSRPQRELNCNDYSTHLATKGKETIVLFTWLSSFNSTFWHFTPPGKLTQDLYKVINSSSDVIGFTTLTGLNMLSCAWMHDSQSECHSIQSWDQN